MYRFRFLAKMWRLNWLRIPLIILGVLSIFAAIWFGFPMTGVGFLSTIWFRAGLISLILATIFLVWFLRWRKRRKAADALEESLLESVPVGDGKVLAERMSEVLASLKKSGGKTYLYDLPWYLIIGPPGAGKTTALMNSGIEFPGSDIQKGAIEGFGGTKNCDWWFAEQAVLIDTAGRYTTQDSNETADAASWEAFLNLLKKGRPNQPINGVILAFSVEDMLTFSEEQLAENAKTVRKRLAEVHETLKIDFPVYVLFTKADLIAGFREYFSNFNQSRRKYVWGVTFQTKDREAQTYADVGAEFDTLVSRLSDEVIDRLSEEPDGVSRISIFGLPGQMAMLRSNTVEFLRQVFEPTRYKSNAILRGFYFTSGTQEGTPIDQVLGAMSNNSAEGAAFQPAFMSGKGKSFFLYDLMTKVIFTERDWVSHDARAVRRTMILRSTALSLIALVTLGSMAAFGYSFWQNATRLSTADASGQAYFRTAQGELARSIIDDPDARGVLEHLQNLRLMTSRFTNAPDPGFLEGLGLGQDYAQNNVTEQAYSEGLERMLRPRMLLEMENALPLLMRQDDASAVFRALKVYLLLGGQHEGEPDDAAVISYFADVWRQQFSGAGQLDELDQIEAHLQAMLELDGARRPVLDLDPKLISEARNTIADLPLAAQAYAAIKDRAINSGVPDFNLVQRISGSVEEVFQTLDGRPLSEIGVPGLFTFEGYWGFFLEELATAEEGLKKDRWVLGDAAEKVNYDQQLAALERDLHTAYQLDFVKVWQDLFESVTLTSLSADAPRFEVLAAAASPVASPLLELVEAVEEETRLTRLYEQMDAMSPEDLASGTLAGGMEDAMFTRLSARSGIFQRVALQSVQAGRKDQNRAGGGVAEDTQRRQVERITKNFEAWHLLLKGEEAKRPIDAILFNLGKIRDDRRNAAIRPTARDDEMLHPLLLALTRNNTSIPEHLGRLLNEVEGEFRSVAEDATMIELNRLLTEQVSLFCKDNIAPFFPFGGGRHVAPSSFGQFFAPQGRMEGFFTTHLQPHVTRTAAGLQPLPGSALGERLSPAALKQFDRAHEISLAFFASGAQEPEVEISVTHVSSSPTVQLAVLNMNGQAARTQPGGNPVALIWPGTSSGMSIELSPPERGRESSKQFSNGRWAIVDFLRAGRARISGQEVTVTHQVGGRTITYRLEFNSNTVPFLMPELANFSCPMSLE